MVKDKTSYTQDLEDTFEDMRLRVRYNTNMGTEPIMQTFDLLMLQEMNLRAKLIQSQANTKQRKNLTTNKTRRGGKKRHAEKKKQYQLAGNLIMLKLKESITSQGFHALATPESRVYNIQDIYMALDCRPFNDLLNSRLTLD